MKGHLELYHAWMREPGVLDYQEGRLIFPSERSSTEDESLWQIVDADPSFVESPAQVCPLGESTVRGSTNWSVGVHTEASGGDDDDDDNDDDEWEEIQQEHFNGASQVWNLHAVQIHFL